MARSRELPYFLPFFAFDFLVFFGISERSGSNQIAVPWHAQVDVLLFSTEQIRSIALAPRLLHAFPRSTDREASAAPPREPRADDPLREPARVHRG